MCEQEYSPGKSTKVYTKKEQVIMETTISEFYTSFYIPAIQKLAFHLTHDVCKIGTMRRTAFKRHESFQDVLCCHGYAERVVASFDSQIQSEYYSDSPIFEN